MGCLEERLSILSRPSQLLHTLVHRLSIHPDVLDHVVLVVQVQVAQQRCNGPLGWHIHVDSVVAIGMRWVEVAHHLV